MSLGFDPKYENLVSRTARGRGGNSTQNVRGLSEKARTGALIVALTIAGIIIGGIVIVVIGSGLWAAFASNPIGVLVAFGCICWILKILVMDGLGRAAKIGPAARPVSNEGLYDRQLRAAEETLERQRQAQPERKPHVVPAEPEPQKQQQPQPRRDDQQQQQAKPVQQPQPVKQPTPQQPPQQPKPATGDVVVKPVPGGEIVFRRV